MKTAGIIIASVVAFFVLRWAGYRNVEATKAAAPKVWEEAGFRVVGYEGYQWGPIHGSYVWYIVRRKDSDDRITYHGALAKWGGEFHIYELSAIDAVRTQ